MNQPESEKDGERPPRTSLALQRERTGKLRLGDLRNYFHLPIEEAAKRLRLCPTVVKKICRRYGLLRWPHRKIKSLERQIQIATPRINSIDPAERATAEAEIQRLRHEIDIACTGRKS
ncbi:protein RKD4-like [Mangifera indica]|uniref:protein RKD4-like n=1 Tax=Mangifera indica TaxID=29780 RepID=UPI001CF9B56B|nr:protein RKD4-like [Mangifera indica]